MSHPFSGEYHEDKQLEGEQMTDYNRLDTTVKIRWGTVALAWMAIGAVIVGITLFHGCGVAEAEEGKASYYTVASCQREGTSGVYTANGERYDEQGMTCALRRRDFGRSYLVCGPKGCAEVRHNDYGPGNRPTRRGVIIDLTPMAFKEVCGDLRQGVCDVVVTAIVE